MLIRRDFVPGEALTLRLPRAKHKREGRLAGSLRPELAHILLLVAGVKPKDVLLDPFVGYGAIPTEAMRGFGLRHVLAFDKIARSPGYGLNYQIQAGDATDLKIDSQTIDKIVCDPPWGIYEKVSGERLSDMYAKAVLEMARVLKNQGILMVLSGNMLLDDALKNNANIRLLKEYPILVSGKKARILKTQKF